MLLEPIYVTGFDEQIHYLNAHWIGCTKYEEPSTQVEDYYYGYPWEINTTTISANESIEERMDFFRVMNDKTRYTGVMTDKYEFKLSSVGYLNQAFMLKIRTNLAFAILLPMAVREAWKSIALYSGCELCDRDSSNWKTSADGNRYDAGTDLPGNGIYI